MAEEKLVKKKKNWYNIIGSGAFKDVDLGETIAYDDKQLIGRKLNINLMEITGDVKKQSARLIFKIKDVNGNRAVADLIGYEMLSAHTKRLVRELRSKVDDSFITETKDKIKIKVKPLILTRNLVSKSISSSLRKKSRELLNEELNKNDYGNIINMLVNNKIQRQLRDSLKKIYPLAGYEVRMLERFK